ncbi:MAG: T9SS type A sorting domain-containing protein [Candidatus Cloacimonetes bacterium]|nr:T9SS type A sorting domain-containing protein [Candidatus Cloacimonadota bacterium]
MKMTRKKRTITCLQKVIRNQLIGFEMFKKRACSFGVLLIACLFFCVALTLQASETIMGYTLRESLFPPNNFTAEEVPEGLQLNWDIPTSLERWFSYASDSINPGLTIPFSDLDANGLIFAHRYPKSELDYFSVTGGYLAKVKFGLLNVSAPSPLVYTIKIWTGGVEINPSTYNAGELVYEQVIPTSLTVDKNREFVEIDLDNLVLIPSDKEMWIGIHVDVTEDYVLCVASGDGKSGYGNLINYQGNWTRLNNLVPWHSSVPIHAYAVENEENIDIPTPLGYLAFRNAEFLTITTETSFLDRNLPKGTYLYELYALYENGASYPASLMLDYWGEPRVIVDFPYNELFQEIPYPDWTRWSGKLEINSHLTPFDNSENVSDWSVHQTHWHNDLFAIYYPNTEAVNLRLVDEMDYWLISPEIYLGQTPRDYYVIFEMAYVLANIWGVAYSSPGDMFALVISLDNGVTWSSDNIIARWDHDGDGNLLNDISHNGESVLLELRGYSGSIRLGFYGRSESKLSGTTVSITAFHLDSFFNDISFPPPRNLTASQYGKSVILEWEAPEANNGHLLGYRIMRDDTVPFITGVLPLANDQNAFIDDRASFYTKHTYQVMAVYASPHFISQPSNTATIIITDVEVLFPPQNLELSIFGDEILMKWEEPINIDSRWFSYSGDIIEGAFGTNGEVDIMVAHDYYSEDLLGFGVAGKMLTKVAIGLGEKAATDISQYTLMVWTGSQHIYSGHPGHLIYEKVIPMELTQGKEFEWIEIDIDEDIYIPFGDHLWVGYRVQGNYGNDIKRPIGHDNAGVEVLPGVANNIFWNQRWDFLTRIDPTLWFNFSIQAYATSTTNELIPIYNRLPEPQISQRQSMSQELSISSTITANTDISSRRFNPLSTPRAFLGYRVYVDNILVNPNLLTGNSILIKPLYSYVAYYYSVSAVYSTGESNLVTDWVRLVTLNPPMSLIGRAESQSVILEWQKPEPHEIYGDLIGYKVYREGVLVSDLIENEEYSDTEAVGGVENTYVVRAVYINPPGESNPSNEVSVFFASDDDEIVPVTKTELLGNFPNPFNPETIISFNIAVDSVVSIDIFNIRGQRVRKLVNDRFERGSHNVVWNGKDDVGRELGSGVYLYRMQTDVFADVRRLVLLK